MKECKVIFTRSRDGEIEMYRQVDYCTIAREGEDWDSSTRNFMNRLYESLSKLKVRERLVLRIELQTIPTRQVYGAKKGS